MSVWLRNRCNICGKTQMVLDALQQTLFCGLHKGFRDFGNIKKVK